MEDLAGMDSTELVNHIMQTEDKLFESTCLKKLGLVERKGLDGQAMLYPIEKTQKKLETFEQKALVDRLYKVKKLPDPFLHMNPKAKKEIEKNMKLETEVQLTHRKHTVRSSSQNTTRRSYINTARNTTRLENGDD